MIDIRDNKIRQASLLFSNSFFKKLVVEKNMSSIKKYVSKYVNVKFSKNKLLTYQDVICSAYSCFENNYRFEYLYKNKLINQILLQKYKAKNTVAFTELNVAKSIADLVLINGRAVLYEIKTELDKTARLENQIGNYYKCFDKINIVTHESLISPYLKLADRYNAGLIIYNSNHELEVYKTPSINKNELNYVELFKLLRKNEILSILAKKNIICIEVPNTRFFNHYLDIIRCIEISEFQSLVFQQLKLRKLAYTPSLLSEEIPIEIKHIYNCLSLNPKDSSFLLNLLRQPISS